MDKMGRRIGKKILYWLKERGMTSEKLSYENGISKGYISDIVSGKKLPSLKMLAKIAKALRIDIKELF